MMRISHILRCMSALLFLTLPVFAQGTVDFNTEYADDANTVGLWHFNGNAANSAAASAGIPDLTLQGPTVVQAAGGKFNGALSVGGGGGGAYILDEVFPQLDQAIVNGSFTLEFWVRPTAADLDPQTRPFTDVLTHYKSFDTPNILDSGRGFNVMIANAVEGEQPGLLWVRYGDPMGPTGPETGTNVGERGLALLDGWGPAVGSDAALTPNVWNHVALTRNGSLWKLWINGELITETETMFLPGAATSPLIVGAQSNFSAPLRGMIDEVRISKVARDPSTPGYLDVAFADDENTVDLWHFDGDGSNAAAAASAAAIFSLKPNSSFLASGGRFGGALHVNAPNVLPDNPPPDWGAFIENSNIPELNGTLASQIVVETKTGMSLFPAAPDQGTIVFSDSFESHTDYATSWVSDTDNDPGAPPVGASWASRESNQQYQIQVWRDPVAGGTIETPYGDQFLHMWRESQAYTEAWGALTASGQADLAAQGKLRIELDVYVLTPDGWGGNLSIAAWDSSSPGSYSNRAFDVSFGGDGIVRLWNGSQTITDPNLDAVFDTDTWEHAIIDTDFVTDTWSITIDGVTVGNIAYEAGNLSKIQQINLGANDRAGRGGRGAWDNLLATIPGSSGAQTTVLAPNTWTHVGITRQGDAYRMWVNGAVVAESQCAFTPPDGIQPLLVGVGTGGAMAGMIDELRVSKVARDLSTVPGAAHTDDSDTVGLWHFDGSGANSAASGSAGAVVLAQGSASFTASGGRFGGAFSAAGAGGLIADADIPELDAALQAGDFTIEFFVKPVPADVAGPASPGMVAKFLEGTPVEQSFELRIDNNGVGILDRLVGTKGVPFLRTGEASSIVTQCATVVTEVIPQAFTVEFWVKPTPEDLDRDVNDDGTNENLVPGLFCHYLPSDSLAERSLAIIIANLPEGFDGAKPGDTDGLILSVSGEGQPYTHGTAYSAHLLSTRPPKADPFANKIHLQPDEWAHVAVTRAFSETGPDVWRMWVNDKLVSELTADAPLPDSFEPFVVGAGQAASIGGTDWTNPLHGLMDEVRISKTALLFGALPCTPVVPMDYDCNGKVDLDDFGLLRVCATGATIPNVDPTCATRDLDGDTDVDMDDFGLFQRCFSGAAEVDPQCMQ